MDWEPIYLQWRQLRKEGKNAEAFALFDDAKRKFHTTKAKNYPWLIHSLKDEKRKWFVASVFLHTSLPKRLFVPMMDAAIAEPDPTDKWPFAEACARTFGAKAVRSFLKNCLNESKSAEEKKLIQKMLSWSVDATPSRKRGIFGKGLDKQDLRDRNYATSNLWKGNMNTITLNSISKELSWLTTPLSWGIGDNESLSITAGKSTDLFIDPAGAYSQNSSPMLMFKEDSDFILSAKIEVDLQAAYDAGALLLYADDRNWAKLCLELSPQNQPTIVTVVTRSFSDDCNSVSLNQKNIYLRISKIGPSFAFHFSEDKKFWHLVRYFTLGNRDSLFVGFSSQSPTGDQCTTVFTDISYSLETLKDIRNGE